MIGPWKSISYVVKFGGVPIAFNIHTACSGIHVWRLNSTQSPFGVSVWIIKKIDNILAN